MYRIALCDDDLDFLRQVEEQVKEYCSRHKICAAVQCFEEGETLLEYVEDQKIFDVCILDIKMPRLDGMQLARKILQYSKTCFIIFLTSYESYAVDACGMDIFRYILKDRLEEKLRLALDEVFIRLSQMESGKLYIISNQRKYLKISQRDILYIYKKQKNAVFACSGGKEAWERATLQEVYRRLDNPDMIFVDRGIILNLYHIAGIVENTIRMDDGYEVATSRTHIMELKHALSAYWGKLI